MSTNEIKMQDSLRAFVELSEAGFRISKGELPVGMDIYRFWWNNTIIPFMPDIDHIKDDKDDIYAVKMDGHTHVLSRTIKPTTLKAVYPELKPELRFELKDDILPLLKESTRTLLNKCYSIEEILDYIQEGGE